MFRLNWWTRRRIAIATVLLLLLTAGVIWQCGTEEVRDGQPWSEAEAALWRAGAYDWTRSCGAYMSVPRQDGRPKDGPFHAYQLPDGRSLFIATSKQPEDPDYTIGAISVFTGDHKDRETKMERRATLSLRRSVLAFFPRW
jgi:hypothetical protein